MARRRLIVNRCALPLLTVVALFTIAPSAPPRRVALVIGNSAYRAVSTLANPANDSRLVSEALRRAGFDTVQARIDLDKATFDRALREFRSQADGAEVALVYYAGHGMEASGRNWLIPTDAALSDERDLDTEAVDLDRVLVSISGARGLRIVVLDACRDNPFAPRMRRINPTRAITRGLGEIEITDTLVVYAARAGTTAADGTGRNSPFATAFSKHISESNVEINFVFRRVRDDVLRATAQVQEPFVYGSLSAQEFYLVPRVATASAPTASVERKPAAPTIAPTIPEPVALSPDPVIPAGEPERFDLALVDRELRDEIVDARDIAKSAESSASAAREAARLGEAAAARARDGQPGTRVFDYGNGRVYAGDWRDHDPHGHGVVAFVAPSPDAGARVAGEFVEGTLGDLYVIHYPPTSSSSLLRTETSGSSGLIFARTWRYAGSVWSGLMHGSGVMLYKDGSRFEGHWSVASREGAFVYWNADGRVLTAGYWTDPRPDVVAGGSKLPPPTFADLQEERALWTRLVSLSQ